MKPSNLMIRGALILAVALLSACTTTTIDEYRRDAVELESGASVAVLGRRHASGVVTEPFIISCVGKQLAKGKNSVKVLGEQEFQDELYPWFEPRTAPLKLGRLQSMLRDPLIAQKMDTIGLKYIVWIDGKTERGESAGGMSCAISPAGGGCLGFGTWEDDGQYEVSVWDIREDAPVAELSVSAEGTSYMPAFIVPVPLVARVKTSVCNSLAGQIKKMFPEK